MIEIIFLVLGILILGIAILFIFVSILISIVFLKISRHRGYRIEDPSIIGLNYEELNIITSDGKSISAWLIKSKGIEARKGVILFVHGHYGDKTHLLIKYGRYFNKLGYDLLSIDLRNHGKSDDLKPVTLGLLESDDVIASVNYLRDHILNDEEKVIIMAESMGACASFYASMRNNQIKCIISDSCFSNSTDAITGYLGTLGVPELISKFSIKLIYYLYSLSLYRISPLNIIQNITIPIFFMHNKSDELVPFSEYVKLTNQRKLNGTIDDKYLVYDGPYHLTPYNPEKIKKEIQEFITKDFLS